MSVTEILIYSVLGIIFLIILLKWVLPKKNKEKKVSKREEEENENE